MELEKFVIRKGTKPQGDLGAIYVWIFTSHNRVRTTPLNHSTELKWQLLYQRMSRRRQLRGRNGQKNIAA